MINFEPLPVELLLTPPTARAEYGGFTTTASPSRVGFPATELARWGTLRRLARQTVAFVSDHPLTTDADLAASFARVQQGDQEAFAVVYDQLAARIFGTIKRVLRDPAMSEEVTQEVFVEMWRQADRFDSERASVTTWAITMARRRAVDRVRREQSQRRRIEELGGQRIDEPDEPAVAVIDEMEAGAIRDALFALPDEQRDVLVLSFLEGLPHGEIAERLQLPLGTVKGRVRGGLKKLRAGLEMTS